MKYYREEEKNPELYFTDSIKILHIKIKHLLKCMKLRLPIKMFHSEKIVRLYFEGTFKG